ncbi:MAG: GtrA family protein [Verrucomicrobiota bacterium]
MQHYFRLIIGQFQRRKSFIYYSIIGASGALLDYAMFLLLLKYVPVHYMILNAISTTLGITNNFFWNAHLNFGVRDNMLLRFCRFYAVGIVGLAVASLLLYVAIGIAKLPPAAAKLLTIFIIVLLQYNLNKRVSFSKIANK